MELSPFLFGLYKLVKYAVYPFTWLVVLSGLMTILVIGPISPRRLRWIRVLAASTLLLTLTLGNPLIASTFLGLIEGRYPPFDHSTSKRFDAIVVLGGGVAGKGSLRPSDQLSPLSMERTICGADLFAHGYAPRVLLSGGDATTFGQGPTESIEMKRLAVRLGVAEAAIIVEERSRTTYENAVEAKRLLGEASILLVTSASHIPRAVALFRKQGFTVTPSPCGYLVRERPGQGWDGNPFDLLPGVGAMEKSTIVINEIVGFIVHRATGKI